MCDNHRPRPLCAALIPKLRYPGRSRVAAEIRDPSRQRRAPSVLERERSRIAAPLMVCSISKSVAASGTTDAERDGARQLPSSPLAAALIPNSAFSRLIPGSPAAHMMLASFPMWGVIDPSEHAGGMRRRGLGNVGRTLGTPILLSAPSARRSGSSAAAGSSAMTWPPRLPTQVVRRTGQPSPDCPADSAERDPFPKSLPERAPETALPKNIRLPPAPDPAQLVTAETVVSRSLAVRQDEKGGRKREKRETGPQDTSPLSPHASPLTSQFKPAPSGTRRSRR